MTLTRKPRTSPRRPPEQPWRVLQALVVALVVTIAACGDTESSQPAEPSVDSETDTADAGSGTATPGDRIAIGDDEALIWGDGDYGVLLAHGAAFDAASWTDQASEIAATGNTALAVGNITEDGLLAAVSYLEDERGITNIAFVGGSAGADAILTLLSSQPALADQIILLSPNRAVDDLGEQPKLFIASEDEPGADVSTQLAETATGTDNRAVLLPGSAHAQNIFSTDEGPRALQLLLDRIREFR